MFIPKGIRIWLIVSAIIVIYDASYVLLRPLSMRGGKLFSIFFPYELYTQYDTLYANLTDSFVVIQSWLNIVEAALLFIAVYLSNSTCIIKNLSGAILSIVTSAFVYWKTVIFLIYDKDYLTPKVAQLTPQAFGVYIIPSSLWIIFPLLTMIIVGKNVIQYAKNTDKKEKKKGE